MKKIQDKFYFPRVEALPPYILEEVTKLRMRLRQDGVDVIDLGMGNPDGPTPELVVDKLVTAARDRHNHRYSQSRGIPNLRAEIAKRYLDYDVKLDPDKEVLACIGAKDALRSVFQAILNSNGQDRVVSTNPAYPIHFHAIVLNDGQAIMLPLLSPADFLQRLEDLYRRMAPKRIRALLISFPHNPTTICVDLNFMKEIVRMAAKHGTLVVHDFAYADGGFEGYRPPSILQVSGAKHVAVEIFSMSKSYNMAGWRMGFLLGNAKMVNAARRIKSYMDYGQFQPIQIASIIALRDCKDDPARICAIQQRRRNILVDGLNRAGWPVEKPAATMFLFARIPESHRDMGSFSFSRFLLNCAHVAAAPCVGFVHGRQPDKESRRLGEEYVRFACVENENRLRQATHNIKLALQGKPLRKTAHARKQQAVSARKGTGFDWTEGFPIT